MDRVPHERLDLTLAQLFELEQETTGSDTSDHLEELAQPEWLAAC